MTGKEPRMNEPMMKTETMDAGLAGALALFRLDTN